MERERAKKERRGREENMRRKGRALMAAIEKEKDRKV